MTDLIIKRHVDSLEEALEKAKARGAWIVDDSQEGTGFSEDADEGVGCVSGHAGTEANQLPYDHPAVIDAQRRAEDAGVSQEIDEATLKFRESNTDAVRKFRFNHQEDYLEWVPGRILKLGDFLNLLQRIRPDAFVAEQQIMGLQGIGFIQGGKPVYSGVGIQNPAPEWSQLILDIHQTPVRERYRGWRTVLLACVKGGFITESQCDEVFGRPTGPRSRPWHRELYRIRNGRCAECRKDHCICADHYDILRADKYQYSIPQEVMDGKQQRLVESRIWTP